MLYVGETMRFECEVTDPRTGAPLNPPPSSATLEAWPPGASPANDDPAITQPMEFIDGVWAYDHDTTGMAVGRWTYRVIAIRPPTGGRSFEYATFTLYPIPTGA